MGKGPSGNTATTTTQSSPPPAIMGAYTDAINRANTVSQTPYQPYTGNLVAPFSDLQSTAFQNANAPSQAFYPLANAASTPFYDTVGNYMSPYLNDVVNATGQQFANQNAIQQQQLTGNAVSQGAWGGDRSAIAGAELAGQQQANQAPVLAGLLNTGYQTALGANEAQNWLNASLAQESGNVAGTQLGLYSQLGGQEQQQAQAGLNVPYEQYLAAQAYPFQTSQFYTNAVEGIGGLTGGTSTTTAPGPSTASQVGGLLTGVGGLVGALKNGGGRVLSERARGGGINPAKGEMPKMGEFTPHHIGMTVRGVPGLPRQHGLARGGVIGYDTGGAMSPFGMKVPDISIGYVPAPMKAGSEGPGPPKPPTVQSQPQQGLGASMGDIGKAVTGIKDAFKKKDTIPGTGPMSGATDILGGTAGGAGFGGGGPGGDLATPGISLDGGDGGFDLSGIGEIFRSGGIVHHYDDGGDVPAPEADIAPTLQGLDPGVAKFVARESNGMPFVGYTSPDTFKKTGKFTDLKDAPLTPTGRPDWTGDMGDAGRSFAFGPAQINGKNWDAIAPGLGVKDWRAPGAYASVVNELHRRYGDTPWDASAPKHGGGTQVAQAVADQTADIPTVGDTSPAPTGGVAPPSSVPAFAHAAPDKAADTGGFGAKLKAQGIDPWLMLAMAGFATAGGSSPFAMQNIGQGFLKGTEAALQMRQQAPDLALKRAQAQKAEMEVDAWKQYGDFYKNNKNPTPQQGADVLDGVITKAQKLQQQPGAVGGITPPATPGTAPPVQQTGPINPAAPAQTQTAPQLPPAPPELTAQHNQVQAQAQLFDNQITQIQQQIAAYRGNPVFQQQQMAAQERLASLMHDRAALITNDPLNKWQAEMAATQGKIGPTLQQKTGEEQIITGNKATQGLVSSDQERLDKDLRPKADQANDTMGTASLIHDVMQNGVATGWGADWKLEAGRVLRALGMTDEGVKNFAGTNVPAGQEAVKLFLQQSASAVRGMGAREPGSVISLFAHAYPNLETDPNATKLMENVLYMQGLQSQNFYNQARAQHTQAVSDLNQGKTYTPLDKLEKEFRSVDGAHSSENYLHAAQAMSGDANAWKGMSVDKQRQIMSLIPTGHSLIMPDGTMAQRSGSQ